MKNGIFFGVAALFSLLFVNTRLNAQLDTVWADTTLMNQYIFPVAADPNYEKWNLGVRGTWRGILSMAATDEQGNVNVPVEIAQRYETEECVKIVGAAVAIQNPPASQPQYNYCDTATVEVWDADLVNVLYSKTFVIGGGRNNYPVDNPAVPCFLEVLFEDTLTLCEDYHLSIRSSMPCSNGFHQVQSHTDFTFLLMSCYLPDENRCTPQACRTKHKPYVKLCHLALETGREVMSDWKHVDSVNWRTVGSNSYNNAGTYNDYNLYGFYCDTVVNAPLGVCPIRMMQDTASQDSVSSSLKEVLKEECLVLYPNPAGKVLKVSCEYKIQTVAVLDTMSRLLEKRKVDTRDLQIPLDNYPPGTYLLRVSTAEGMIDKKFVVQ